VLSLVELSLALLVLLREAQTLRLRVLQRKVKQAHSTGHPQLEMD
jgi:hypothetical protein